MYFLSFGLLFPKAKKNNTIICVCQIYYVCIFSKIITLIVYLLNEIKGFNFLRCHYNFQFDNNKYFFYKNDSIASKLFFSFVYFHSVFCFIFVKNACVEICVCYHIYVCMQQFYLLFFM